MELVTRFSQTKAKGSFFLFGPRGTGKSKEVKHSRSIGATDLKGLSEFQKDYPEWKCLFLYRGKDRHLIKNILCLPVEEFLVQLMPNKVLFEHKEFN